MSGNITKIAAAADAAYEQASRMQRLAAGPDKSVFVSANAGSGKTRVLVQRVSRLLLAGSDPDKILCLTYTKAAAAEMQARLFSALGDWSVMAEDKLQIALNELEDSTRARSAGEIGRARRLFARALETPGGLKVQTIHAFCENLLRRFPIEAGLPPGAEALSDEDAGVLHEAVWTGIETRAVDDPGSDLGRACALLASCKSDDQLESIYKWAMYNAYKIDDWQRAGGPEFLAARLGIALGTDPEHIMRKAWQDAPKAQIKTAADNMMSGGSTDITKAGYIYEALTAANDLDAFKLYQTMFFTQKGAVNASIVTAKAGALALSIFGSKKTGIGPEALRVITARVAVNNAKTLALTAAVYDIALAAAERYRSLKYERRAVDFDDQIHLARRLLMDSAAREWVLYKLDGGVDHVLVDEAQDTSKTQWDIVEALSDEFFQGGLGNDRPRTLFAVGDEKQSIYSFQGAQPEVFLQKAQNLIAKQTNTPQVNMAMSFRSAPQILALVDHIFYAQGGISDSFDPQAYAPASDATGHSAFRRDGGVIEFWPASKAPLEGEPETPWKPAPVDKPEQGEAREQLASALAAQIQCWLSGGEAIFDKDEKLLRPMRPGDIMILVRKRTSFFDAVIRHLKICGVPVAGADRLNLSDAIAVKDMISLAKFTLLPSDDLSLAEVLKSPLFGWSDDELLEIAYGREGSLWAAVPRGKTQTLLRRFMAMARRHGPYEFFARVLAYVTKDGRSILQKIYDRLGLEAEDALDGFLASALAHQRQNAPSLTHFIAALEASETTLKRQMDGGQNEVRVMTVHAAKGLEAPVVILPDTTQKPTASTSPTLSLGGDEAGFIMDTTEAERPVLTQERRDAREAAGARESMRLLYVALTRAESRLLVCGFESNRSVAKGSWHERVHLALRDMQNVTSIETPFGDGLRYGAPAKAISEPEEIAGASEELPSWARREAPAAAVSAPTLSPSRLSADGDDPLADTTAVRSPGAAANRDPFRRGNIIHKLLQILPSVSQEERASIAAKYLTAQTLDGEDAQSVTDEVFNVLDHPDFAPFFAEGSLAEVSLAGRAKNIPVTFNGQIDRLAVRGNDVWILDYKSNRPPPNDTANIAPIYVRQMAAYRALAQEIYPGKTIHCALLWTHEARLMLVPNDMMDAVNWQEVLG